MGVCYKQAKHRLNSIPAHCYCVLLILIIKKLQYISHALYSYSRRGADLPFDWEDRYIRRYGNPERRITVIEDNGNIIPLTFKYIKRELLPNIFENIVEGLDSKSFCNLFVTMNGQLSLR